MSTSPTMTACASGGIPGSTCADDYYAFLDQPPVEQVQRLYSVDEVKRSARVRDIARRVDLDTITFEFGSASIAESEIERLEGLANAMDRLLKENPAETFAEWPAPRRQTWRQPLPPGNLRESV